MPPAAEPIREIDGTAPGALNDTLLAANEPVVLRGLAAHWPFVSAAQTSFDAASAYLGSHYRDETVLAMLGAPEIEGRFFYNGDLSGFNYTTAHAHLGAVLGELRRHLDNPRAPAIYVGSTEIDSCLPGFRDENNVDLGARDALANIWIGNRTRIAAHYDLPDNLACVAAGRRRFTLFPPEQVGNLYVGPLDFTPAGQAISLVDFHAPDLARFPRFAEAMRHARVAELGPGDALFLPSMWWHHIEALDAFNVLVNYWWRQSPPYMDTPTNALLHALMSVRELPPEQRRAWQELFRHYVFEADASTAAHVPPAARGILAPLGENGTRQLRAQLLKRLNR